MPAYDAARFNPPAPVAYVTVHNPETGDTATDVSMLIDSGADVTLIPRAVLAQVGGSTQSGVRYELAGFDGTISYAEAVQLEIVFCRRRFRGQYLLTDESVGVVGRNVLNAITLLLDGPNALWDEQPARRGG
jgi:hypothetical protein